jgi:hypothetical protein
MSFGRRVGGGLHYYHRVRADGGYSAAVASNLSARRRLSRTLDFNGKTMIGMRLT